MFEFDPQKHQKSWGESNTIKEIDIIIMGDGHISHWFDPRKLEFCKIEWAKNPFQTCHTYTILQNFAGGVVAKDIHYQP